MKLLKKNNNNKKGTLIFLHAIMINTLKKKNVSSDLAGAPACMSFTKYVMSKWKSDVIFASQSPPPTPTLESRG